MKLHCRGFTILELMVALIILTGLSVFVAETLRTSLENRSRYQGRIAVETALRDTLRLLRTDLAAAYHHQDIYYTIYNDALEEFIEGPTDGDENPGEGNNEDEVTDREPPMDYLPIPANITGFLGHEDRMTFTVANHTPTAKDAPESDLAQLTYFVANCRLFGQENSSSRCLYRRVATTLGDLEREEGTALRLVEGIETFSLRYLGPGQIDLVSSWRSQRQANENSVFPYAVEIQLTLVDPETDFTAEATILAPIRNPNNPKDDERDSQRRFRGF